MAADDDSMRWINLGRDGEPVAIPARWEPTSILIKTGHCATGEDDFEA